MGNRFIEKIMLEFKCAVRATCNEQELSEKLEQGSTLSEIMTEEDLDTIFRKMKFYIFD